MEIFFVNMPQPYKCMMSVHDEGNVPRVAIEELLWDAQPLRGIDQCIVILG
jgi:hypothetical protein